MEYDLKPGPSVPNWLPEMSPPHPQLTPFDPWFGEFLGTLRSELAHGSSEFGTALMLFTLAVNVRATRILEIGRCRGLSTLALAGALRFNDVGWTEAPHNKRPDVDYLRYEYSSLHVLYSVDLIPQANAEQLISQTKLTPYVKYVNMPSSDFQPDGLYDLVFIDGDHSYEGCLADVKRYVPYVRNGGYFVLHDYFGWYDKDGKNNSPIKRVIDEHLLDFEHLLIDTGYQSYVIFRCRGEQEVV
jgi:Methyltransferase domain